MHQQSSINVVIEAWIDHLLEAGGQTVIMPDNLDTVLPETFSTPKRQSKRPRNVSTAEQLLDSDATPRPRCDQSRDSLSEIQSSSADAASTTSQSGRSSPRKKEVALRRTLDWPVVRARLTELQSVPSELQGLALDLKQIADSRRPLIPSLFQVSFARCICGNHLQSAVRVQLQLTASLQGEHERRCKFSQPATPRMVLPSVRRPRRSDGSTPTDAEDMPQ